MNLHPESPGHLAKQIKEMQTERIIQKYHAPLNPPRHHMIPPSLNIYAQWSCHAGRKTYPDNTVKSFLDYGK